MFKRFHQLYPADSMASDQKIYRASTTAPVNIAVIKYWGKRDPTLNLPTNSSLSVTLSQSDLRTHTTASCSSTYRKETPEDSLLLNGKLEPLTTPRSIACLRSLRALRSELESTNPSLPKLSTYPLRLASSNNFPTAAGLASSAAGFAALVRAIADLYELPQSPTELSLIARQGSGSACRSLLGGYVAWDKGSRDDGTDSCARLVAPKSHWPEMRALILVASAEQKSVSSTAGMQTTVKTSGLFRQRVEAVPQRMLEMEKAIREKDFEAFAEITRKESNSFHATCLDTDPPIFYMNETSKMAIRAVEAINKEAGRTVATYTFDAGPNCVIYYLEKDWDFLAAKLDLALDGKEGWSKERTSDAGGLGVGNERVEEGLKNGVSRVIMTSVGEGPISVQDHLIDEHGKPV
ncbi:Diphosphomevalonate decarboxylase [Lepraria neglecta]|uniref:Diphosphomevalonate decarboxylase n=1 Tax=Lepraria neglecta TaxID=209136 RepID=A0AAE0DIP7_9LECA|nr:Diphosphomevalonate decarboxylase [Lepraria neglecta]